MDTSAHRGGFGRHLLSPPTLPRRRKAWLPGILVLDALSGGVRRCAGRHMARPPRTAPAPAPTPRAAPGSAAPGSPGPSAPWASRASRSWRPNRRAVGCPVLWAPEKRSEESEPMMESIIHNSTMQTTTLKHQSTLF